MLATPDGLSCDGIKSYALPDITIPSLNVTLTFFPLYFQSSISFIICINVIVDFLYTKPDFIKIVVFIKSLECQPII